MSLATETYATMDAVHESICEQLEWLLRENEIVGTDKQASRGPQLKVRRGSEYSQVGDVQCYLCGHIFFNCRVSVLKKCPKCEGQLKSCDTPYFTRYTDGN